MTTDIQPADRRVRRVTTVVLALAALAAIILVFAFQHWMTHLADRLPTGQLIVQLRRGIGLAMIASGLCLLLLAGYAAWLARATLEQRRWPPASWRVLHDTPIRHDEVAKLIGRRLNIAALVLTLLAVATAVLSWRLFAVAH